MGNGVFLFNAATDSATVSGGSWQASLPASNVQKPQRTDLARSTGLTAGNTLMDFDLGSARGVKAFGFTHHNLTSAAQARVITSNDATFATNTGSTPWQDIRLGNTANTDTPWSGHDSPAYLGGHSFFYLHTSILTGRYVRFAIQDTANGDGYVQVGRFMAGIPFEPKFNFTFGASMRVIDPSSVAESIGGQEWWDKRSKRRGFSINYDALSEDEAVGPLYDLLAKVGLTGNLLFCYDPNDPLQTRPRRTIYCRPETLEPMVEANASATAPFTASLSFVELL